MFDPASMVPASNLSFANSVDTAQHRDLARRAAAESIVLLRNQAVAGKANGDGGAVLPFGPGVKDIAVIGPNANRTMSLVSNYPGCKTAPGGPLVPDCNLTTPLDGIVSAAASRGARVRFAQGCDIDTADTSGFEEALVAAQAADVVVFVGGLITCQETGDQCQEAEAKDRVNVTLPGVQPDLLRALNGTNLIVVIESGSTVSIPFEAQNAPAILQMFYPGLQRTVYTSIAPFVASQYAPWHEVLIVLLISRQVKKAALH